MRNLPIETLLQKSDEFLTEDEYGKAVWAFELALEKMPHDNFNDDNLQGLHQSLAFTYGIIGEHTKAIPIWKGIIAYKEQHGQGELLDHTDLLDDYFAVALSCEHESQTDDFLFYIHKGLEIAKQQQLDEYIATFEHELGGFRCDQKEYEKALAHLNTAINIRQKLEDVVGLAMSKMYLGILWHEQNNLSEAKKAYEEALNLTKKEGYREELTQERQEIEEKLSQIQTQLLQSKLLKF